MMEETREEKCVLCKHFFETRHPAYGECRLNPPIGFEIDAGFVTTYKDAFCGQYSPNILKIEALMKTKEQPIVEKVDDYKTQVKKGRPKK